MEVIRQLAIPNSLQVIYLLLRFIFLRLNYLWLDGLLLLLLLFDDRLVLLTVGID
jgi:hypothetical protein